MKKVNLILQITLAAFILVVSLSSCKEDEVVTDILEVLLPDGEALSTKFSDNLKESLQSFTLDASNGGSVVGEDGTMIYFAANSLINADGDSVFGDVNIELIEVLGKADMLLGDKPTMGRNADGAIATLVSAGEFFINAKQDDEQLFLREGAGFSMMVPTDNIDDRMALFSNEDEDCLEPDCEVVWEEEKQRMEFGETSTGGMAYYGFASQFGWTNIDRWYGDPRPKTTIFVDVPEGYDHTNCAVYLSYDGEPTALASFDRYDEDEELFTEHYGLIPIGLEVHFIVVSVIDDEWQYVIQAATITEDHVELIGELSSVTESDLIDIINDLP